MMGITASKRLPTCVVADCMGTGDDQTTWESELGQNRRAKNHQVRPTFHVNEFNKNDFWFLNCSLHCFIGQ